MELATRTWALQVDLAVFVQDQLRQVGIETTLKQMESAIRYPALARRDYTIGANLTAVGIDDPDALFSEQYKCGSVRNSSPEPSSGSPVVGWAPCAGSPSFSSSTSMVWCVTEWTNSSKAPGAPGRA